jgi:Ser/Thr protein kinase RdoA (MazF antagonist)/AraC-like DNA-binding protein
MQDYIKPSLDYIEQNLKTEIKIEELAQMTGYSVVHYCRLFKQATGLPVTNYISKKRINHALSEISSGRKAIDTVLEYGFDSYSGFYKAFIKMYGCSPSKYSKPTTFYNNLTPKEMEKIFMDYNKIAEEALKSYSIQSKSIEFISERGEVVYKVTSDDNKLYCLKLYIKREKTILINSELEWVAALARDTDITVQEPYKNKNGKYVTVIDSVNCTLAKWLEGKPGAHNDEMPGGMKFVWALFFENEDINEHEDKEEALSYISVLGKMHRHSSEWTPPAGFERPVNEFTDSKLADTMARLDALDAKTYNKDSIEIIKQAGKKAFNKMKTFEKNKMTWGLIHGDYGWCNFVSHNQEICPIDFAGCGYDYYLADVALAVHFVAPAKRKFFLDIYSQHFPLPDDYVSMLETFTVLDELGTIGTYLKWDNPDKDGWLSTDFNTWAKGEFCYYLNDEPFLFDKKSFVQWQ